MEIIKLKIADLTPSENNAKEHPKKQVEEIKNSINQFGFCDPVGIWGEKNIIVEGHGRVLALQEMGETEVECIRLDHLTDDERKAYTLTHNKTTLSSDFDFDKQLTFTPNYGKPLKVTRSPKKRRTEYIVEEIPPFVIENDKTDDIQRALQDDTRVVEEIIPVHNEVAPEVAENRDIKIDINNPESLPVPKSLKSYVIAEGNLISSQEAFDQLATGVNKEIMLEIPSLNGLSDKFLSQVPTIYSRVIIDEFDVSDMSYMFLVSSLLKQGVHIKTVPKVHTVNLITDDTHAMIISEGENDLEYGAVYNDRNSISSIRANFERTWNIASNLDDNILITIVIVIGKGVLE